MLELNGIQGHVFTSISFLHGAMFTSIQYKATL